MLYRFGTYELDAQRCELRCAGQQVAIEPKVFDVLLSTFSNTETALLPRRSSWNIAGLGRM